MANNNTLSITVNVGMNGAEALHELANSIQEIQSKSSSTGSNVSQDFNKIGNSASKNGETVKSAFSKGLSGVSEKVRGISEAFSGLNGVMSGLMGTIGLGSFKSMTLDMAMTRDQAKNLLAVTMQGTSTFAEASQTAGAFIDKIKEGTSGSVVKLQMMIEAMNGIKLSTGMANNDLESLNDVIRKVGEASLLMGDDTEHATFVMKEAMSGLNGDFSVLKEQFGITAEKMKDAGWSGAAEDVQGYRQALEQCLSGLGDMGQVMDTTSGKVNKIKSNFSSAGLEIGNQMLPAVDWLASSFLDANENGNLLAKGILYAGGAASLFASLAPTLKPMFDTYDSIKGAVEKAKGATDTLVSATETMDSITAALTGTKAAETVATDAETVAEEANALAKGENALGTEADAAANVTLTGAMSGAATSAWALTTALLSNPVTWIAIAIIALVAVMWYLYDTNEEVRNSLNELWGIISGGLGDAWNALSGAVTSFANALVPAVLAIIEFVKWFAKLFTDFPAAKKQFDDFVSGLGDTIVNGLTGLAGMALTAVRNFIIGIADEFTSGLSSLGDSIMAALPDIPTLLLMAFDFTPLGLIFNNLLPLLMPYITQFGMGLLTSFRNVVLNIVGAFTGIVTGIRTRLTQAWSIAGSLVTRIRQLIITRFNVLVASVTQIFTRIVNSIKSKLTSAASAARQKALAIYNSIKEKVSQVPDIVKQEFDKIKDRIKTAIDNAKNTAYTAITDLVNTVKRALGIASPGFIQRMFTYEFTSIPGIIQDGGVVAVKAAGNMASNVVSAWNDNMEEFSVPFAESIVPQFNSMTPQKMDLTTLATDLGGNVSLLSGGSTTNNNSSSNVVVNNYEKVVLDLNNLPHNEKEQWWNMLQTISRGA